MNLSELDIVDLVPQRQPMLMVDKLIYADEEKTQTSFIIKKGNLFFENEKFSESGLIENIAQTAAAGVGYICKRDDKNVPIGFIAAIKDLNIYKLPLEGAEIKTEVKIITEVLNVSIVKGTVHLNDTICAECEMRIFIKSE